MCMPESVISNQCTHLLQLVARRLAESSHVAVWLLLACMRGRQYCKHRVGSKVALTAIAAIAAIAVIITN